MPSKKIVLDTNQYINGTKKPSKERERLIMNEIILISQELQRICA